MYDTTDYPNRSYHPEMNFSADVTTLTLAIDLLTPKINMYSPDDDGYRSSNKTYQSKKEILSCEQMINFLACDLDCLPFELKLKSILISPD